MAAVEIPTADRVLICKDCDESFTWTSSPADDRCESCALRAGIGGAA